MLSKMASKVVELFDRFEDMRGLKPIIAEIEGLESEGNRIYRRAVARLFSGRNGRRSMSFAGRTLSSLLKRCSTESRT